MRAAVFSSRMCWAVSGGTSAVARASSSCASEMNGAPLDNITCAWVDTEAGTSGLLAIPDRNDEVSAAISTAPASAVPTEAPRLVTVFCSPPTSSVCSSGTAPTVTAPNWEANAPIPNPASSIGQVTIWGPAPWSSSTMRVRIPASSSRKPRRATRRGFARGNTFGMPTAVISRDTDRGSTRTPVATADSPSATDRNSGTTKNKPICSRNWKKKATIPPLNSWSLNSACTNSAPRTWSMRCCSHLTNPPSTAAPRVNSQITGETPNHTGAPSVGCSTPQLPALRMPNTIRLRPVPDNAVPTRSSRASGSGGVSAIRRVNTRITTTITTSLANTNRHDRYVVNRPPINGPAATATAPAAAIKPYARGRSEGAKFDATSATIAGMINAAPMPSNTDHPTINTARLCETDVVNDPAP